MTPLQIAIFSAAPIVFGMLVTLAWTEWCASQERRKERESLARFGDKYLRRYGGRDWIVKR